MNYLIAISFWIVAIWLIRKDTATRTGISPALWIPTLWVAIVLSRPLTMWLGFGGGADTLEGSPLDRMFFLGMIAFALVTLKKRNLNWSWMISRNWPIVLFYAYFLISVFWSDSPISSFKRWFKDFGNVFIALVILTERDPQQAFRAVFVRCAYVLLPLSVILVRFFPAMGRSYTRGGDLEVTGVTMQKNTLGALVLVCGLVLIWDWLEKSDPNRPHRHRVERYLPSVLFLIGVYLLYLCDSKTSIVCVIIGAGILLSIKLPLMRRRVAAIGRYTLLVVVVLFLIDWIFGLREAILGGLGRDATLTGRTDVWRELLALKTNPLIGTGFCSFWSNQFYLSRLPPWVGASAHNGYLEIYIDGGYFGLLFLLMMLLTVGWRTNRQLARSGNFALVRFAVLMVIIVGDLTESHFARMSPLWFMFLLTALELPRRRLNRTGGKSGRSRSSVEAVAGLSAELVLTVARV